MAGSFGFEKKHYDISMTIGEQALFPAVRAKDSDWEIAVMGVSCRQQIEHGTGRPARHLVEVLRDALHARSVLRPAREIPAEPPFGDAKGL